MVYKVKIGWTENGKIIIGNNNIKRTDEIIGIDYRYPSQFDYMVIAIDDQGKYQLTTKREIAQKDWTMIMSGV